MNELKSITTTTTTTTSTQQNNNSNNSNTQTKKKKPISNGVTIINNNVSLSKIRKQFGQIKFEDYVIDNTTTTTTTTTNSASVDSITPSTTTPPIKKKKSFIVKDQKDPKPTKLKKDIQLFSTIKENYLKEKQEKEKQQETIDNTNENTESLGDKETVENNNNDNNSDNNKNNNSNNQIYYHEYINQMLPNTDINNTCKELIGILRKFQEKSFANNPDKPKKRYVFGLRETLKLVESKQIQCVIITPTIEENGALNKMVEDIIRMCRSKSIQYTFALSSRSLGKLIGKTIKISVLGVLDINGVNEQHQKLSLQTKQSRDEFFKLQKEFLKQQQQDLVKEEKEQELVKEEINEIEFKVLENQPPIEDKVKLMMERNENIKEYKDIENLFKQEKKQIKKEYKEKQKEFQVIREQKQELELKKELERKRLLKLKQKELKQKDLSSVTTTAPPKKQTTTATSTKKLDVSDQLLYDNTTESNKITTTTTTSTLNKKKNKR